jgi:type IV pilus assembly protein PilB
VFSTLHTNDAPSAITRMVDIGVEPYLLAATLEAIIAQRLVRRVCEACREWYDPPDEVLFELNLSRRDAGGKKFAAGKGCELCHGTGYRGRMALFEFLVINEAMARGITEGWSAGRLREAAVESGLRGLRESGLLAIFDGQTTPEEVVRETLALF